MFTKRPESMNSSLVEDDVSLSLKSQVTFSSGLSKDNIDEEKSDEKLMKMQKKQQFCGNVHSGADLVSDS